MASTTSQHASQPPAEAPRVIQWLVDTRRLWPAAQHTRELEQHAARPLALLTPAERAATLRFHFVRDAKTALASHLLKRLAVRVACGLPWAQCVVGRDGVNGKPAYVAPPDDAEADARPRVAFNASHQAGVVALAAVVLPVGHRYRGAVDVGVDVVCTSERRDRDRKTILARHGAEAEDGGWPAYVDMHADVLAAGEVARLKAGLPVDDEVGALLDAEDAVDARLRYFYALWCLREAYVKMTGEALLAPWLGALEFRDFRPPPPPPPPPPRAGAAGGALEPGREEDVVTEHDIVFHGRRVDDVNMCLQALGPDYMLATAVRTPPDKAIGLALGLTAWKSLSMDDIVELAGET